MRKRISLILLVGVSFLSFESNAGDCNFACKSIPASSDVMVEFGGSQAGTKLPSQGLKVLVWNVHKGGDPGIGVDLDRFLKDSHVAILQEALDTNFFRGFMYRHFDMATSFFMKNKVRTGVATASTSEPLWIKPMITKIREPFVKSPKAQLMTRYAFADRDETLLVINIHGLLMRGKKGLKHQMGQIEGELKAHTGPVIYAGDFNTKNRSRTKELTKFAEKHGLEILDVGKDPDRRRRLDHILVRGFKVDAADLVGGLKSSDHPVLRATLTLLPSN